MKETPITVLENKILYYKEFKRRCETREGIVKNEKESEEEVRKKFDKLITECDLKISEFEDAIYVLNSEDNNVRECSKAD